MDFAALTEYTASLAATKGVAAALTGAAATGLTVVAATGLTVELLTHYHRNVGFRLDGNPYLY